MLRNLRFVCLTFALLMLLSVSVHPAMAQMDVKDRIEKTNAAIAEFQTDAGCPGCKGTLTPEKAAMYLNRTNISVNIREIEMDSGYNGPTVSNVHTVRLPMGTLQVQSEGSGTTLAAGTSNRSDEIIAEYDNDSVVKTYIHNVTSVMGYTDRTAAEVKHYAVDMKGANISQNTQGVFEVVTFSYTNMTTKFRFKFAATRTIDGDGKAIPPIVVVPGQEFPPLVKGMNPDAECWYWYLLIGIAVLSIIAAIAATIALAAAGGTGISTSYYTQMKASLRDPGDVVQDYQVIRISDPHGDPGGDEIRHDVFELVRKNLKISNANAGDLIWTHSLYLAIIIFLILIGILFPLVGAAILFLAATIVGLLVCKGIVSDENDKARLEEMLNPETLVGISERENGQRVLVPPTRSSQIMVALPEQTEDGVPYTWNVTTDPATTAITVRLPDSGNPGSGARGWMFFTPLNKTITFTARYIPAYGMPGPEKKKFTVDIVPLVWAQPVVVDDSSKWVGYGTSLAIDKNTDRMHISYLDYSGTWGDAGKLIYRSGIGSSWESPVVVDDTISWTTKDNAEMARYTSIALGPDGSPHITYMDWKNGHLKYAHLQTWDKTKPRPPGTGNLQKSWWVVETVDASSVYAGWGSSIAVDKTGNPHISYLVQEEGYISHPTLHYAHRTTDGWKKETLARNLVGHNDGKFWVENVQDGAITSIALDSQDHPHISYVDYNRQARPMTCGGEMCVANYQMMHTGWNGTAWNTEAVDQDYWISGSYTRHGLYSSIAIDPQDRPHISYFSIWNNACTEIDGFPIGAGPACDSYLFGNLKFASYNGSVWSTQIVDSSTTSVGLYSSLKIDPSGNPHISYMDWKNGFLRYATSSGGSYWFRSVPDRQNSDTGRFSSLALDSKGMPRILYMDYKSGHVKYVYGTLPTAKNSLQASALAAETGADPVPLPASFASEQIQVLPFPTTS
jgi:hypothetical protein